MRGINAAAADIIPVAQVETVQQDFGWCFIYLILASCYFLSGTLNTIMIVEKVYNQTLVGATETIKGQEEDTSFRGTYKILFTF